MNCIMKLLLISLGLATLAAQILCQQSAAPTEVNETNEVPISTIIGQAQPIQEPAQTEEKKLAKRSHGWEPWGWPEYSYGWPWPGWGHGWGHVWGHGSHGGHGGWGGHGAGWYGGSFGEHGWPWWYGGHHGGWHGRW